MNVDGAAGWAYWSDDEDPMVLFAGVGDDADSVYLPLSPRLDGDGDRGEFGAVPMIGAGAEALTRSSMHNLNPHFGGAFSAIFKDKRELQGDSRPAPAFSKTRVMSPQERFGDFHPVEDRATNHSWPRGASQKADVDNQPAVACWWDIPCQALTKPNLADARASAKTPTTMAEMEACNCFTPIDVNGENSTVIAKRPSVETGKANFPVKRSLELPTGQAGHSPKKKRTSSRRLRLKSGQLAPRIHTWCYVGMDGRRLKSASGNYIVWDEKPETPRKKARKGSQTKK